MILDRMLAVVAPGWALRRMRERMAWQNLRAMYDGARNTRRTRGWRTDGTGPNAEVQASLSVLRARSRDLVRNNAWAKSGLEKVVAYQVGTGILPRADTGDRAVDKEVDALFTAWAKRCNRNGRADFFAVQAQLARSRAEAGEGLAIMLPLTMPEMRRRGLPVPLALQVIEPDHLDETYDLDDSARRIRQGIEVDAGGAPLAYWLRPNHPGETDGVMARLAMFDRYDARDVLHVFEAERPGQLRGVPDLASVMTRMRALDELEDAALEREKVQACLAAFVTSQASPGRGPLEGIEATTGDPLKSFSPGMIERLLPGEDVKFAMPSGVGGFSETARHQLHAIAAGFGLTYDLLTGDLSQANYSSLRAGRLAFKRRLEQAQWLMLVPAFERVWDRFIAAAIQVGALDPRAGGYPAKWAPPRFEMVDPVKDTLALNTMVRSGFLTWGQAVAEFGYDPHAQAEEIRNWNAEMDEYGLILDADPRRTGGSGGAQNAAANAAIEIAATGAAASNTGA